MNQLSNLDLYVNDYLITTVQGDGLIISTPTGRKKLKFRLWFFLQKCTSIVYFAKK